MIKVYKFKNNLKPNYSYMPILVEKEFPLSRDSLYEEFIKENIFPKKYFYPLLTEFEIYKNFKKDDQKLTIAENAAKNILCLPIYPELEEKERVKL